jgi:hypothetical protein
VHQHGEVGEIGAVALEEPKQVGLGGQACERKLGEPGKGGSFVVEAERVQKVFQGSELAGVARYRRLEDLLLGGEVAVEPAAAGGEPCLL